MSEEPMPPAPPEQVQVRARLKRILAEWGVPYRHEDHRPPADDKDDLHAWSTVIDRGREYTPLEVWFSGREHELTISGDQHRRMREWVEWVDVDPIEHVLDEMQAALAGLLAAPQRRPRSRTAAALRMLTKRMTSRRGPR